MDDLMVAPSEIDALRGEGHALPSVDLTVGLVDQVEMLLTGALRPLKGFPGRKDCEHIISNHRLENGAFCPVAPALGFDSKPDFSVGDRVGLRDPEGVLLAVLEVSEVWQEGGRYRVAGPLFGLARPSRHSFPELRTLPGSLVAEEFRRVLAWPVRRAVLVPEVRAAVQAAQDLGADCWMLGRATRRDPGDAFFFATVREWRLARAKGDPVPSLTLMPDIVAESTVDQMLGDAFVARNCGATHFLIPYGEDEFREAFECFSDDLRLELVEMSESSREPRCFEEVLLRVCFGEEVEEGLATAEMLREMHSLYPVPGSRGLTILFTGLSGSGKSTVANVLVARLMEMQRRAVTLLDGDVVRKHLSSELGFSRAHRDLNVLRIGYVASEVTRAGGIAVCCPIAPYSAVRREVRRMVLRHGAFVEVHVSTPLEECERRDRKGLYALARAGKIKQFTGIDDPYEEPEKPEIRIDTTDITVDTAARQVLEYLVRQRHVDLR